MNPWLEIPLEDYEGHMALDTVAQAQYLARILKLFVHILKPRSVAVLGCAGGNGFEGLPPDQVRRVVGVDLNPGYLAVARERHKGRFSQLEFHCAEILSEACAFEPVDFVLAGLIFEYVDYRAGLAKVWSLLNPGGHVCVILQLPNASIAEVTPTPFESLGRLNSIMALVPPAPLEAHARSLGFSPLVSRESVLESGKAFHEFVFRRP